jgi:hypothetical protein
MPKITRRNNQSSSLSSEPLIDWLKKRGYWVPYSNIDNGGKKQPLTHVFLNGGKASVPDSARREFNEKYVDSLLSGHDQFAVERTVGDVFKMFVDIDIKSPQMTISSPHDDGGRANGYTAAVQKTSKEDFVKEVAFTVLKHMPLSKTCGATLSFRVANDKTKKRKRADGEGEGEGKEQSSTSPNRHIPLGDDNKQGAHIVWEGQVDKIEAIKLRDACVNECRAIDASIDWDAMIDAAVYRNNGLRMIFSKKKDSPSYYKPAYDWNATTQSMNEVATCGDFRTDMVNRVSTNSIHVPALVPAAPALDPDHFSTDFPTTESKYSNESGAASSYATFGVRKGDGVVHEEDENSVEQFGAETRSELRALLPPPYKSAKITGVKEMQHKPGYVVYLDCRFCRNYQKDHRSNRVFLMIDQKGIHQCCFCTCDTVSERLYGKCKDVRVRLTTKIPKGLRMNMAVRSAKEQEAKNKLSTSLPSAKSAVESWMDKVEKRLSKK